MNFTLQKNRAFWIIAFLVVSFFICVSLIGNISRKKDNEENNVHIIDLSGFEINNRVKLVKDKTVYFGENLKELENSFYDIKISTLKDTLEVTLNKLWITKWNEDYIEDEYLIEIVKCIVNTLEIDSVKEDVEYELYKYIKQNFIKVKNKENVEKLELESIIVNAEHKDGECVLYIKKGV